MTLENIHWEFLTFNELGTRELYRILKARLDIFCIEQNSLYQDLDDLDFESRHCMAWSNKDKHTIAAYIRLVPPKLKYDEVAVTRVITAPSYRGKGLAKEMMKRVLQQVDALYPKMNTRLSAQQYLERFYAGFGFETVSDPYSDTGIIHIEMLLRKA